MEIKLDQPLIDLRDYLIDLAICRISIATVLNRQIIAIQSGILPEECQCTASAIMIDLRRVIALMNKQMESVAELIPDGDIDAVLRDLHERSSQ